MRFEGQMGQIEMSIESMSMDGGECEDMMDVGQNMTGHARLHGVTGPGRQYARLLCPSPYAHAARRPRRCVARQETHRQEL